MYDELVKRLRSESALPYSAIKDMREAANAIEELICEVADEHNRRVDAEERQRWIPVTERLPEEDKTVLTFVKKHQCVLLDWMHDNKWCCFGVADYWMPLPEPPKEVRAWTKPTSVPHS